MGRVPSVSGPTPDAADLHRASCTALPAPTGELALSTTPYPFGDDLLRELQVLLHPWGVQSLDDADLDAMTSPGSTYALVRVEVLVPTDVRATVLVGWVPRGQTWQEAVDAILGWLPGAVLDERDAGAVHWGSRTPGWTPTARWVVQAPGGYWLERDRS